MGSLRGRFSGMKQIGALPLTTVGAVVTAAVLTLLACTVVGALLPRLRRARGADASGRPHRLRRGAGAVVAVLVPALLALATGGLALNRSGDYVPTVSDLVSTATSGKPVTGDVEPLATPARLDAVPASRWRARFTRLDDGSLTTTFRGPVSGLDLSIRVILPQGYSPTDGRTYDVIEGLHGYPGDPGSFSTALGAADALNKAISAGLIPPSIMVMPSLDPDGRQHDCANISGRPAVGTWVAQEIPRMVAETFPNTTRDRSGWLLMGLSSGAYCAAWLAMNNDAQYGSAGVMSSYDRPVEGSMAHGSDAVAAANTLSTMVRQRTGRPGLRYYVLGSQDDPYAAALTAWRMQAAQNSDDVVTSDTPVTGGHTWKLWSSHLPTMLRWWGSDPAVFRAAGLSTAQDAQAAASSGITPIIDTPLSQRTSKTVADAQKVTPTDPGGPLTLAGCVLLCLLGTITLLRWGPRGRGAGAWVLRSLAVLLVGAAIAATIGLVGNSVTGFATSWDDLGGIISAAFQ